jgi:polysaccharide biosynthesis transport protein
MNRSTYTEFNFAPAVSADDRQEAPGVQELVSTLSLYRVTIAITVAAAVALGLLFAITRSPFYVGTAEILLSPGQMLMDRRDANIQGPGEAVVESEIEILKSPGLISLLIEKVGEAKANAWIAPAETYGLLPIKRKAGEPLTGNDLIEAVRDTITVTRRETSYVLEVRAASADPASASELANLLVDTYIESKLTQRVDSTRNEADWLSERLEDLKKDVETKEAAVEDYRAAMDVLAVNGNTVAENQLASIQNSLVDARAIYTESRARLEQMRRLRRSGGSIETLSATLNSATISDLRQREADVAARRADIEQRYGPQHPDVKQIQREHDEVRQQIDAEVRRIMANLENEVEVAGIRVAELQRSQGQLEGRLVDTNRDQVRLRALQREAEAASQLYQQYLILQQQMAEESSRKVVDARIVSLARVPTQPASPGRGLWVAFFTGAGVFLGIALALIRRAINNRLVRPEDVQRKIGLPALVSVPLVSKAEMAQCAPEERSPAGVVAARPMSRLTESVRVLLSQILADAPSSGQGMILSVTSAVAHEGKTTTVMSLGRVAAMNGQRVLLVDGDLRMRSLSKYVAEPAAVDLVGVLRKNDDWRSGVVADDVTSAELLPAAAPGIVLGNLFSGKRMQQVLQEMRAEYDVVIIDCPPILAVADARTLCAMADRTVIVTHWNRTPAPAVRTAVREIETAGGKAIGIVLNQLKSSVVKRISYGDSLYLGAAGSKYYTN